MLLKLFRTEQNRTQCSFRGVENAKNHCVYLELPSSKGKLTSGEQPAHLGHMPVLSILPAPGVYQMSVSEAAVPGEEVGRVKAKDPDIGENGLVAYSIIDGDGMDMFEITTDYETQEGVVKLKKVSDPYYVVFFAADRIFGNNGLPPKLKY